MKPSAAMPALAAGSAPRRYKPCAMNVLRLPPPAPARRLPRAAARIAAGAAFAATLAPATAAAPADGEAAALAALRGPAPIALMRHADAPGVGDPPGWKLDDCATQRNLSPQGRADAAAVGRRLRAEKVDVRRVLSSPWCRCLDTARLLELGPVQTEPAFSNAFVLDDQRQSLEQAARRVIAGWRGPGVLMVVTHGANILALTGRSPASGEIVVADAAAPGSITVRGSIAVPR